MTNSHTGGSIHRTISIGAMEKKLSVQLAGLNIPKSRLRVLDKLANSLTWCLIHRLITNAEYGAACRKLIAKAQDDIVKAATTHTEALQSRCGGKGYNVQNSPTRPT